MGGPSPPGADSVANKALQYGIKAGTAQNELNQVNQITPTGSLTYSPQRAPATTVVMRRPNGVVIRDATGKARTKVVPGKILTNADGTPRTVATTKLNAPQQGLLNAQTGAATSAASTAGNIIGANAGQWAAGPNMDETGITKALMGWGHEYLDPGFEHDAATQDAKLANQGIAPGSEAYDSAVKARGRTRMTCRSVVAITVADLGAPSSSAISPK